MRFVVILKQIPDDSIKKEYQDVDQLNDSDKNVIKEALDLRDRYGGTVDVIGFGPLSAEDVMKETLTYGIDDAFLISDSQFADMDVSQVAKIVAAVIKKLGPYDLVLCGLIPNNSDNCFCVYPFSFLSSEINFPIFT